MDKFIEKLRLAIGDKALRGRLIATAILLVVSRVLAIIPVPGVDTSRLASLLSGSDFVSLLNLFSGGGLSTFSIVMLGVGPYITASIIMQLMTVMSPKIKALYHEEGEAGRKRFTNYSRLLTVPLAMIQGFAVIKYLQGQNALPSFELSGLLIVLVVAVAGSILLMWLGELISEFGIGNGISLIIFAGIVTQLPASARELLLSYDPSQIPIYLAGLAVALVVTAGVVFITEAERPISITYAKQMRGGRTFGGVSTYLPLRINQAGVIPIIFALSILLFPQMFLEFLARSSYAVASYAEVALRIVTNNWFYSAAYFFLVVFFTYFYTAVTFDPNTISTNLQKSGAFISGVRPGPPTSEYISSVLSRLTLAGALFLGIIAILPLILRSITGIQALAIGGTALLIVVSVVIDLVKRFDAQLSAKEY